jgi:hypothetical protein
VRPGECRVRQPDDATATTDAADRELLDVLDEDLNVPRSLFWLAFATARRRNGMTAPVSGLVSSTFMCSSNATVNFGSRRRRCHSIQACRPTATTTAPTVPIAVSAAQPPHEPKAASTAIKVRQQPDSQHFQGPMRRDRPTRTRERSTFPDLSYYVVTGNKRLSSLPTFRER